MMQFTDAQKKAIVTTGKHLCVNAGAGSGKTRVLVERIVHILDTNLAELSQIVAITFTRKAASEMRERLRTRFHEKVPKDDSNEATKWLNNIRDLDSARITTIDSFCAGLLREYGLWVNDDPDFTMMNDADSKTVPIQVVFEALERLLTSGDEAALRLVSAMGMRDARKRLSGMLAQTMLHPWLEQYAAGTAEDLKRAWLEYTVSILRETADLARVTLRNHGSYDGKYSDFLETVSGLEVTSVEDLSDAGLKEQLRELSERNFQKGKKDKCDPEDQAALSAVSKEIRETLRIVVADVCDREYLEESAELTKDFADVFARMREAYREHKSANSLKDFGDLLLESLAMLRGNPELRERAAGSIRHLLMDEFQDTNGAQWDLARALMRTQEQPGAELFIVGDAKQSIYRFRNAQVEVFQEAQSKLDVVVELSTNFRTASNTLDGINAFFARTDLLVKVASPWSPLLSNKEHSGAPGLAFLMEPVPKGFSAHDQLEAEAGSIARHIARHVAEACDEDAQKFGDFAILFRSRSNIYLYENALRAAGVPFETLGGNQFFSRQEITDLINALRVTHDPHDETALLGVLRSPMVGLDDNSVVRLGWRRGLANGVYGGVTLSDAEQQARLDAARAWLSELQGEHLDAGECVRRILQRTDLEAVLATLPHGRQRVNNVRKFHDTAREFVRTGRRRLYEFMLHLDELTQHEIMEEDAPHFGERHNAVTLMTIHASKGLEFPNVIVADASRKKHAGGGDDGYASHPDMGVAVLPPKHGDEITHGFAELLKRRNKEDDLAEDARVLYVAMTRTERQLVISGTLPYEMSNDQRQFEGPPASSVLSSFDSVFGVVSGAQTGASHLDDAGNVALLLGGADASGAKPAREKSVARAASESEWLPVVLPESEAAYLSVSQWLDQRAGAIGGSDGFTIGQFRAARRGTIAHAYLEAWDFDGDAPEVKAFLARSYPECARDSEMAAYLKAIAERLRGSALWDVVRGEGALHRELPFTMKRGELVIGGTIDALTEQGTLIDYKSGAHRSENETRYALQLGLYADALESLRGKRPNRGVVYYLDSADLVEIPLH